MWSHHTLLHTQEKMTTCYTVHMCVHVYMYVCVHVCVCNVCVCMHMCVFAAFLTKKTYTSQCKHLLHTIVL